MPDGNDWEPANYSKSHAGTVTLIDAESGDDVSYKIVGEDEADLKAGKISIMSPIARAIVGKSVGDEVAVQTPSGELEYEIDSIEHV